LCLKIQKLWVITKPGLVKVWALCIKKGCASVLTQPLVVSQSKVFVTLGISFSLWQSYIFVLTFLTKPYE
ncbi:hypothetical protein OXV62_21250, partial [Bacteroides faecis]|nr:hypothetical protein [Bacteroides faecis]